MRKETERHEKKERERERERELSLFAQRRHISKQTRHRERGTKRKKE